MDSLTYRIWIIIFNNLVVAPVDGMTPEQSLAVAGQDIHMMFTLENIINTDVDKLKVEWTGDGAASES